MGRMIALRDVPDELNEISSDIWGAAIEIHKALGPHLLESAYRRCLAHELRLRGRAVSEEHAVPLAYKGLLIDNAYRIDLLVEGKVIVELKTVDHLIDEHEAQLLTYMRLMGVQLGLMFNMRSKVLREAFLRRAMSFSSAPPRPSA